MTYLMMYTLDVSGRDENGAPGITRFGGLFFSIDSAAEHGRAASRTGRFAFAPERIWIRNEDGSTVRQERLPTSSSVEKNEQDPFEQPS